MFSKILVPIDGSDTAWNALEYARTLGEKFNGTITVIHVVKPSHTISMNGDVPYIPQNIAEIEGVGRSLLKMAQDRVQNYPSKIGTILDFGNPANRILFAVKEQSFDTVVIGCRGLSGIAEIFLGSVSTAVAQHSPVPVLIVK
jgi:nucleotide-binding universal stress UspA family protein